MARRMSLPKFLSSSSSPAASCASSFGADGAGDAQQIRVVVRVRPLNDRELLGKTPVVVSVARASVQVVNPVVFLDPSFLDALSTPARPRVTPRDLPLALSAPALAAAAAAGECRTFHFDRCFGVDNAAANASEPFAHAYDIDCATQRPNQELVFEEVGRDLVAAALEGFNCTVLAYGQTGSGKTHTMVGEKSDEGKGLIPRVCEALFAAVDARRAAGEERDGRSTSFSAHVSYCEIYKEKVSDLLDPGTGAAMAKSPPLSPSHSSSSGVGGEAAAAPHEAARRTLRVREHPATGPFVEGLSARPVASYAAIAQEMLAGEKLRTVAATLMNPASSRSHAVFTITFTQTTVDPATQTAHDKTAKLSMIDLAGSERANASGTSGDRLKEGAMINKSLTTLGRVISALSKQGGERVPYRDSTLTWLLKESLGGNAKTTMIAMISPSSDSYDETMSTLRYAESAKRVVNRAVVNEDKNARVIRQLRQEIQDLRLELEQTKRGAGGQRSGADAAERDEFFAQLVQEVEQLRWLQVQSASRPPESQADAALVPPVDATHGAAVHVHTRLPSLLVDVTRQQLRTDGALAYALAEGATVFGSAPPPPPETECQEPSVDEATEQPSPSKRSWSPTFLRRKASLSPTPARGSGGASPPRKSQSPRRATEPTPVPAATFYALASGAGVAAQHVRLHCARASEADGGAEAAAAYTVEVEAVDASARVYVNGALLSPVDGGQRVRMRHADHLQLGDSCFFTLHAAVSVAHVADADAPHEAEEPKPRERLADLVHDANAICARWRLNMAFALGADAAASALDGDGDEDAVVLVTKHPDDQRLEWTRPMLEAKVAFLRELAASLQDARSIAEADDAPREKAAALREPDAASEDASTAKASSSSPLATPSSCVRLIGRGRVFMPPFKSYSSGPLVAAVFSGAGESIGKLFVHLQYTVSVGREERRPSFLALARRPSLLAASAQAAAKPQSTSMRVHLDKLVFDEAQWMARDGVSLTLTRWASASASSSSAASGASPSSSESLKATATHFSTPRLAPVAPVAAHAAQLRVFEVAQVFETRLSFGEPSRSSAETAGGSAADGGDAQDDFVAFEVWGYGPTAAAAAAKAMVTRSIALFASVDVDEREPDGVFRPVAVKADGALRLRANQPRRLRVRVTQADGSPFALAGVESVAISRPFVSSVDAARLSPSGAKSAQWLLASGCIRSRDDDDDDDDAQQQQLSDPTDASPAPLFPPPWRALAFRSDPERDTASRSLLATLKWDPLGAERVDGEGSRSVFRVAIALTTAWSRVPVVLSKSVVAKVARAAVTATAKLARELEAARMAWWARESCSRDYRLGAWFSADVVPATDDAEFVGADAAVASHIRGLQQLELALELEHLRQQILKMTPVSAAETPDADELSFEQVAESLSTLFENGADQEQRFEIVQLQSSTQLFVRKKTRRDVLIGVKSGSVVDLTPSHGELRAAHFVAEPSLLADGDMAGFLMLSTAFELDEAAVAPLGSTAAASGGAKVREKPPKAARAGGWERRWFVLKRPFLYAYKSFALKDEVGVLDVARCQLLAAASHEPAGKVLASIPFSFQLVCVAGAKCVVWTLQASTAPELRAWLVAIDPLRTEAREAVGGDQSSVEAPVASA